MLEDIQNLSPAERLRLRDAVQDHLQCRAGKSTAPDWQRDLIRDRYDEYLLNRRAGISWEDLMACLRSSRRG